MNQKTHEGTATLNDRIITTTQPENWTAYRNAFIDMHYGLRAFDPVISLHSRSTGLCTIRAIEALGTRDGESDAGLHQSLSAYRHRWRTHQCHRQGKPSSSHRSSAMCWVNTCASPVASPEAGWKS